LAGVAGGVGDWVDGTPGCGWEQQDGNKKKIFHQAHTSSQLVNETSDRKKVNFQLRQQ
jgi:hypothetical protein